jgi:hypothetical protein
MKATGRRSRIRLVAGARHATIGFGNRRPAVIAIWVRRLQFRALMKATTFLLKMLVFLCLWAMTKMMDRL